MSTAGVVVGDGCAALREGVVVIFVRQFWPEHAGKTITSCAHVLPKHRMIGETKKDQIDNMSMPHHKHSNKF